jgi:hypothetical protein
LTSTAPRHVAPMRVQIAAKILVDTADNGHYQQNNSHS